MRERKLVQRKATRRLSRAANAREEANDVSFDREKSRQKSASAKPSVKFDMEIDTMETMNRNASLKYCVSVRGPVLKTSSAATCHSRAYQFNSGAKKLQEQRNQPRENVNFDVDTENLNQTRNETRDRSNVTFAETSRVATDRPTVRLSTRSHYWLQKLIQKCCRHTTAKLRK